MDQIGALEPPTPGTVDVRATLAPVFGDRDHARKMLGAIPVPTLVLETPASPVDDAEEVAAGIADHVVVRLDSGDPGTVAAAVADWWVTTRSRATPG